MSSWHYVQKGISTKSKKLAGAMSCTKIFHHDSNVLDLIKHGLSSCLEVIESLLNLAMMVSHHLSQMYQLIEDD